MANLAERRVVYWDDVDATTVKALDIDESTHSPEGVTVGDANPGFALPWATHFETGSGFGNEVFLRHAGLGAGKGIGVRGIHYAFEVPFDGGAAASGTIQCTVNPTVSGDTIRIGSGAYVYRFRTAADGLAQAYDVKIGASAAETMRNFVRAITGVASGTGDYHAATPVHPNVTAINWATGGAPPPTYLDTATITSRLVGNLGNSVQMIFDGTTGDGTFVLSGATLSGGGGQHLDQGAAYYAPSGWQMQASRGYRDDGQPKRLLAWVYSAPAIPTVQDGGGATANAQLELMADAATSLFTLTAGSASDASDALGKTQYSANGGGTDLSAGSFIWARVPSTGGASWRVPPGARWDLYFARVRG